MAKRVETATGCAILSSRGFVAIDRIPGRLDEALVEVCERGGQQVRRIFDWRADFGHALSDMLGDYQGDG